MTITTETTTEASNQTIFIPLEHKSAASAQLTIGGAAAAVTLLTIS